MKCFYEGKLRRSFGFVLVLVLLALILSGCGSASKSDSYSTESYDWSAANTVNSESDNIARKEKQTTQDGKIYKDTFFENYGVNQYQAAADEPKSTFALDVDTASYTIARNYINNGSLPPKDAIRVEEFVNYFKRQYPVPSEDTFSIYTEVAPSLFQTGYHMIEIGLQGKSINFESVKNSALTFVIDVSGSMDMDNRLKLVKKSLKLLVDQMGPNDKIGIAIYGTKGRKILEHTSGNNKKLIMEKIESLKPEGSTNAAEGLMIGYDMASREFLEGGNNRVILCTDGVANQGVTNPEEILKMIEDYKVKGITLTALGFGMENYNDVLLEKLADKGDGNYAYIDTLEEAKKVFIEQLSSTLQIIAKDAKAQVEFNPDSVESYRLIGYENRILDANDFRNDSIDAGEVGAGHAVTALYEIKLKDNSNENIGVVKVRYKNPESDAVNETSKIIRSSEIKRDFFDATPRFRFINMVAEVAEILKGSYWVKNNSLENVYELLIRDVKNLDMTPEDREFVELVKRAVALKSGR